MMDVLRLIGRTRALFDGDIRAHDDHLCDLVADGRFLVIGGAGSIGQAVTRELFRRNARVLHVVDISENNMVELVRDLRSTFGYIDGDFRTLSIDCGGREFEEFMSADGGYDYVLNLSALKHVRSERDPYTLMRLIDVNIRHAVKTVGMAREGGAKRYFCVSTDKAANPANMMGASKRIMEMYMMRESRTLPISMARFANVAFSDGSLLHGFNQRFAKRQPISAPKDVQRYFITPRESGELCLLSCLLGDNRDIFFPRECSDLKLTTFSDIAIRYVASMGFEPHVCESEDEARERAAALIATKRWPCYFFSSNTTGEKEVEEFYTESETLDLDRFESIGVIKNCDTEDYVPLDEFWSRIETMRQSASWDKKAIVALFESLVPEFGHLETGRYLESRM
ncbi:UDP-N-acetylglucosamine 4,6-dehydratase [Methylosinus sp. LW4]|uniref:UDP-N-acetylglucosamine 4,6-dehydratase n=1 Tax=Methylosinus sp. LW4 TaxID=136993 RepID=UPI00037B10C8|nr:UDP-N-acetylglucosamine 4,6-dehydratase [Methylosinus sp. LW4]